MNHRCWVCRENHVLFIHSLIKTHFLCSALFWVSGLHKRPDTEEVFMVEPRFRRNGLPGSLIPGILSFTTWAIIRLQKEHSMRAPTVGQPPYLQILHLKGDLWPSSSKTTWGRKEEARGGRVKGSLVLGSILAIH